MALQDLIKNPLFKDLGIPALGTLVDAGINFGMMNYQNKFNAQQAQIAREFNKEMDSTKYQRTVTDMKTAGINPALAMNGGITTQAGSNAVAQGATPAYMNMSSVANMVQALSQARLNNTTAKNIEADTEKKKAETEYYGASTGKITAETVGISINNQYLDTYNQLRNEGMDKSNKMTDARINEINENINKLRAETNLAIKQAATEEEKVRLMITEEAVNNARADQIDKLTPYLQQYYSATAEQARASAKLMLVQAAYQQGLIDEGMIEAAVKEKYANANEANAKAMLDEVRRICGLPQAEVANLKSGTFKNYATGAAEALDVLADVVFKVVSAVLTGGVSLGYQPPRNPIGFR